MGFTQELAGFISDIKFDKFSQEAIERSREAFLDTIGVIIAGAGEDIGAKILSYVENQSNSTGDAPVLGSSVRATTADAALAMGTLAHALDFDDVYWPMIGHPSVTIFPVIFALADECTITGKKAIEAFIAGFEVEAILGAALSEFHYHKGWHTTSTLGPFGATAAAAKIYDLDQDQLRRALGIAASHCSGFRQNFGTMTKPLHAGNAARAGITATLLARSGFTADLNILEAELGFANVICGKGNHNLDKAILKPNPLALVKPGRNVKRYPSCGATQTSIDCIRELAAKHKIKAEDVEQIDCHVNPNVRKILIKDRPVTGLEGKFSLPYCVAVGLIDGDAGLKQFTDARVMKPDVQALLRKVNLVPDENVESIEEVQMKVKCRNGSWEIKATYAKGSPENPMSYDELITKFKMCVEGRLSEKATAMVTDQISKLESLGNIGSFINLCCP